MFRTAHRTVLIAASVAAILVLALAGCGGGNGSTASTASSSPAGEEEAAGGETATSETRRTVLVYDHEPKPSPSPVHLNAGLEKGTLPHKPVVATVLTDENCAPDAQGISHCRNVVRLPGGDKIVLRHPHAMMEVPCLEPGEKVLLRRA